MKHGVIIPYDARLSTRDINRIIKCIQKNKAGMIFCFVNQNRDVTFRSKLAPMISKVHENILIYDPSDDASFIIREAALFLIKEFNVDTLGVTGSNVIVSLCMHKVLSGRIEANPGIRVLLGSKHLQAEKFKISKGLVKSFTKLLVNEIFKVRKEYMTIFSSHSFHLLQKTEFRSKLLLNNSRITNAAGFAGKEMILSVLMRPINDIFISIIIG